MPIELKNRDLKWLIDYRNALNSKRNSHPKFWKVIIAQVEQLIKEKRLKEKKVKNILIKFENKLLINYVHDKLMKALDLSEGTNEDKRFENIRRFIVLKDGKSIRTCNTTNTNRPTFIITSAANTDIIIDEVIKEYRKPEYKSFNIGGGFNNNKIKVKVYEDKVNFNGQDMSFDAFITMRNALTLEYGGFKIGGETTLQLTHANTNTKVYINRDEFQPIIETILGKL